MKLWILTNTPSPYQVEFFRALHQSGRAEIAVRFMNRIHRGSDVFAGQDPGFPCEMLNARGPQRWRDEFRLHPKALAEVKKRDDDLFILSGLYTSLTFNACARKLTARGRPWAAWLEQPWPEEYRPEWSTRLSSHSSLARRLRGMVLTWIARNAAGIFGIGTAAAEAYRKLGTPADRVFVLPYYCDVSRFAAVAPDKLEALREGLDLAGKTVFLFSGSLIPRKGADILLQAFLELARTYPATNLLILGDGPLRSELQAAVPEDLKSNVHFAGHVTQEELPTYFQAADVFTFPSRHDGWGVVINEACGAGLPIIATDSVGAARDLVREGTNGFVIPRDDTAALTAGMEHFLNHPDDTNVFGKESRKIADAYSLEQGVQTLINHANTVLARPA